MYHLHESPISQRDYSMTTSCSKNQFDDDVNFVRWCVTLLCSVQSNIKTQK